MGSTTQTPRRTVIGHSTTDKVVLFGGFPLVGLVLGFFLPRIADWAAGKDWLPFQGPLKLIAGWDGWWVGAICIVIGLLAGVLLAAMALEDTLKVTVTGQSVEFLKNQKTVTVPREKVAVAFLDGKEIVLHVAGAGPGEARSAEVRGQADPGGVPGPRVSVVGRRRSARRPVPPVGGGRAGAAADRQRAAEGAVEGLRSG
jgi:hypothetical protein